MPIEQIAEQTRTRQNFVTLMMCLLREVCAFEVGECRLIQGGVKAEVSLDNKRGHFKLNKVRLGQETPTKYKVKRGGNHWHPPLQPIQTMQFDQMRHHLKAP